MAKRKIPTDRYKRAYSGLIIERMMIKKRYPSINCILKGNRTLLCKGSIKPSDYSDEYSFSVEYNYFSSPKAFMTKPDIVYNPEIHMYKNKRLCLYDHRNQPWNNKFHLAETIIPWIAEWFVYYEISVVSG